LIQLIGHCRGFEATPLINHQPLSLTFILFFFIDSLIHWFIYTAQQYWSRRSTTHQRCSSTQLHHHLHQPWSTCLSYWGFLGVFGRVRFDDWFDVDLIDSLDQSLDHSSITNHSHSLSFSFSLI